jgi:hypothetical protein
VRIGVLLDGPIGVPTVVTTGVAQHPLVLLRRLTVRTEGGGPRAGL